MRTPFYRWSRPLVPLLAFMLLASTAIAQPDTLDEVVILQGIDVGSLDPHNESSLVARQIFFHLFDSLVHQNAQLELVPGLAESWTYLDERTVRFHLRQNVVWHNGDPFTADDVAFSLERMTNPDLRATVFWGPIVRQLESWTIEDPHTIVLTWQQPNAAGLLDVGRQQIVPKAYLEAVGNQAFFERPVGTGPYRLARWVRGERVELERNPDFWGDAPRIERLVFRPVPDASTRVAELLAGNADLITGVAAENVAAILASDAATIATVRSGRNAYVVLDHRSPPFDDERVRQAMNYAVDVDEIIEFVMGGRAFRSAGPLAAGNFGFDPDLEPYTHDPERARALLAEAGYPNGLTVPLHYSPGRWVKDGEVAEAIAAQLTAAGVTVELRPMEWGLFTEQRNGGLLEGMHLISLGTVGDPDIQLKYLQSDRNGRPYMAMPDVDELVRTQLVTVDPDARREIIHQAQALARDRAAWIFLFDLEDIYGISRDLDWQPWPNEYLWLRESGPGR
jgi:peptide/nickel transport system substrate-binding protein